MMQAVIVEKLKVMNCHVDSPFALFSFLACISG